VSRCVIGVTVVRGRISGTPRLHAAASSCSATASRSSSNSSAYTSSVMAADLAEHPLNRLDVGTGADGQAGRRVSELVRCEAVQANGLSVAYRRYLTGSPVHCGAVIPQPDWEHGSRPWTAPRTRARGDAASVAICRVALVGPSSFSLTSLQAAELEGAPRVIEVDQSGSAHTGARTSTQTG
jgi:hypothetical protein